MKLCRHDFRNNRRQTEFENYARIIGSVTVYVMLCDASCLHARALLALSHEQDTWASKMETSDESVWRTPSLLTKKELWKTILSWQSCYSTIRDSVFECIIKNIPENNPRIMGSSIKIEFWENNGGNF